MKNAIILHGLPIKTEYYNPNRPSSSNSHWLPWLQKALMIHDIKADTPEIYNAFQMEWDAWVKEVERFEIGPESILVGHSMGGGFWVRYLSEHPEISVDTVVLVAPWVNTENEIDTDFFNFVLDPGIIDRVSNFVIVASDDDDDDVQKSVNYLIDTLSGATINTFHKYGHFTQRNLKDNTFPELLDIIVKL